MKRIITLFCFLSAVLCILAQPADYVWTTPGRDASESMPCGGGDIGMNVWVEDGELLFYISRSGAFDEHNTLLKQGRVRVRVDDAALPGEGFRQTLRLRDGYNEVRLGGVTLCLWADVFRPVIHLELEGERAFTCSVAYENWRHADRALRKGEGQQCSYKWAVPKNAVTTRDSVFAGGNSVTFFHRNPARTVFDYVVEQQGMSGVKSRLMNPIGNLVSGGMLWGDNLTFADTTKGEYAGTDYRAWRFRSVKPARRHEVLIALHIEQATDVAGWQEGLRQTVASIRTDRDRKATRAWWNAYWQRSFIESDGEGASGTMARNYTLFRYMLGCNAYGAWPTKFNGGLFTFDPVGVDKAQAFTPDYRKWGGGTMTAQNQRLVYWGMLKSGDFDMMPAQFDTYLRMLPNAELRSLLYWGHAGGCFCEQIENFGLPNPAEYGTKRPAGFDPGLEYNAWLEYEWDTVLEFCQMILETYRYAGADIGKYIPLVESSLTFFDEHYRYLASKRGRNALDGEGKLILFPGSGCETYKMANNAASTVAALQTVTRTLIEVKEARGDTATSVWRELLNRIPSVPHRIVDGHETIAPAKTWERINNVETPQLYPVFPWRMYTLTSPDKHRLEVARNTYLHDPDALRFRTHTGWKQDNIWAACLGLTDEAARLTGEKLADGPHRFPAFWGPGYDWTPDHNWGGSGMIGLQEMLLQTEGDKIHILPAWPREWNVRFRLHAPGNTTVDVDYEDGRLRRLQVSPAAREADIVMPDWMQPTR